MVMLINPDTVVRYHKSSGLGPLSVGGEDQEDDPRLGCSLDGEDECREVEVSVLKQPSREDGRKNQAS
jgi:hypothetical protein